MRDKKDNATFDLPGFGAAAPSPALLDGIGMQAPRSPARIRKASLKQEQLELLEPTDASGLPLWHRDDHTDLTGLPIWAPDP